MTEEEEVGHKFKESRVISPGLADSTLPVGRERMGASLNVFFWGGGFFISNQSIKKLFLMALASTSQTCQKRGYVLGLVPPKVNKTVS